MVDIEDGNKAQIKKHVKDQVAEIKKAIADTESIDLRNLLDPVKVIAKNEKLIEDLNKEVSEVPLLAFVEQQKRKPKQLPTRTKKAKMRGILISTRRESRDGRYPHPNTRKAKADADKKRSQDAR